MTRAAGDQAETGPPGPIAVLGASGAVGSAVVDRLARLGHRALRLGGRREQPLRDLAQSARGLGSEVDVWPVDLADPASLTRFAAECSVLVNCAGPSYVVLDSVASVADRVGAHYIDAAGDQRARDALLGRGRPSGSTSAVFSAGLMPGLTGLLPLLMGADGGPRRVDVYAGGAVSIGRAGAMDVLLGRGEEFGVAMACWRDGDTLPHSLEPIADVTLPGFPVPVHAYPFLSAESVVLASRLGVRELRAYNVHATRDLPDALAVAWAHGLQKVEADADAVARAAEAAVRATGSHFILLCHGRGYAEPGPSSRRLLLRTTDASALTGAVAALCVERVVSGDLPPGAHLAAEVLDPGWVASRLRDDPSVDELVLPHSEGLGSREECSP